MSDIYFSCLFLIFTQDVFTVSVGNLPPGAQVLIKITYVTELTVDGEQICFSLPGSVAPWTRDKALEEVTQVMSYTLCLLSVHSFMVLRAVQLQRWLKFSNSYFFLSDWCGNGADRRRGTQVGSGMVVCRFVGTAYFLSYFLLIFFWLIFYFLLIFFCYFLFLGATLRTVSENWKKPKLSRISSFFFFFIRCFLLAIALLTFLWKCLWRCPLRFAHLTHRRMRWKLR